MKFDEKSLMGSLDNIKKSYLERAKKLDVTHTPGSTVDGEHLAYINNGKVFLPTYDDKPDELNPWKYLMNDCNLDHEMGHDEDPDASELTVETRNILREKNPLKRMAKYSLVLIGLGQGSKDAEKVSRTTKALDVIKGYKEDAGELFEYVSEMMSSLTNPDVRKYAYARVGDD